MVKVKICGITNLQDALLAESLGADALGFIFTEKSPRCIKPNLARKIILSLGPFIFKAGVFMDQKKEEVLSIASFLGLDILQFHGEEPLAYCRFFQPRFKVIKVCFPRDSLKSINQYQKLDALMFDIPYEEKKKKEKTLSISSFDIIKKKIGQKKRVIISGGLNPENIESILEVNPYGVDLASGVEKLVGRKDKYLMEDFIGKVKNVNS